MSNKPILFLFFFAISWTMNKLDQMHKNRCNKKVLWGEILMVILDLCNVKFEFSFPYKV